MGLRFRKSITLCKGVKLNLGGKSASVSVGTKGIHQSFSTTGRTTTSIGIPGTGVSYVKSVNMKKGFKDLFKKKDEKEDTKKKGGKDAKEDTAGKKGSSAKEDTAGKAEAAAAEAEEAKRVYEEYTEQIAAMKHIHRVADEPIDWQEVMGRPAPAGGALAGLRTDTKQSQEEWKILHDTAEKVLAGDIDTYLDVVDEMKPYDDLLEYGSDFEVGTDDPKILEVEFRVRSEEVIPPLEYVLDAKGRLKEKELSKTAYFDIVQDYVCSAVLRVARDTFALLPVDKVRVHAVDTVLNTATGNDEEITILSTEILRTDFDGVNFDRIDPSDMLGSMKCKMNFKKTQGFSPVDRIS